MSFRNLDEASVAYHGLQEKLAKMDQQLEDMKMKYEERNILQISLIKLQSDLECDSWEPPSI